jgi:hypothetical protein
VPAGSLGVEVETGVDIGPGSVVIATPYAQLRDRSYWVRKEEDADIVVIRLSAPRNEDTPFGWLIVESD